MSDENAKVDTISCIVNATSSPTSHTLIFFITGNPGLIGYYTTYLHTLQQLLSQTSNLKSSQIHIFGQSLAGFSDDVTSKSGRPCSLEKQIEILQESLGKQRITTGPKSGEQYDKIILIGHSVGSYILLELVRLFRETSSKSKIIGGILLFPTITHIAQSPSGVAISRLFRWRQAPHRLGVILQKVLSLFPRTVLIRLVRIATRMPAEFAKVTAAFLVSKIGIWQALHMARDEMETITEDKWDDEIWGVESVKSDSKRETPKLILYFGQNDHWVADHTRDALIAARGRAENDNSSSKPVTIIDQDNIPHGFCLKHGEIMAEKTAVWIEAMLLPHDKLL